MILGKTKRPNVDSPRAPATLGRSSFRAAVVFASLLRYHIVSSPSYPKSCNDRTRTADQKSSPLFPNGGPVTTPLPVPETSIGVDLTRGHLSSS